MNSVIHIGGIVVDTCNQITAARVAKAAERASEVRGSILVDGVPVRWSEVLAYQANGGFEVKRHQGGPVRSGVYLVGERVGQP